MSIEFLSIFTICLLFLHIKLIQHTFLFFTTSNLYKISSANLSHSIGNFCLLSTPHELYQMPT